MGYTVKIYRWTAVMNFIIAATWLFEACVNGSFLDLFDSVLWLIIGVANMAVYVGKKRIAELKEELAVERARNNL